MASVQDLIDGILGKANLPAFMREKALGAINKTLGQISGRVLLPELYASATVTTDTTANVDLPEDFQRNLNYCHSDTNNQDVTTYASLPLLLRNTGRRDQAGRVWGVAVRGDELHYQKIPSVAETLSIYYYAKPTLLVDSDDTPTCLPEHLAEDLLVNGALVSLWPELRNDPDYAGNIDPAFHEQAFERAMVSLREQIGPEARIPIEIGDELDLDDIYEME